MPTNCSDFKLKCSLIKMCTKEFIISIKYLFLQQNLQILFMENLHSFKCLPKCKPDAFSETIKIKLICLLNEFCIQASFRLLSNKMTLHNMTCENLCKKINKEMCNHLPFNSSTLQSPSIEGELLYK